MISKIKKILLASSFSLACALPALSFSTSVTIVANNATLLQLQLETAAGVVVSADIQKPRPQDPVAQASLDFGTVDALAISPGTLTLVGLDRQLLISNTYRDEGASLATTSMAVTDGAVYFINNGYQLRHIKSNNATANISVGVGAGGYDVVVADAGLSAFASGTGIFGRRIAGVTDSLTTGLANNTAFPIDIGLVVPLNATTGPKSTIITFTAT